MPKFGLAPNLDLCSRHQPMYDDTCTGVPDIMLHAEGSACCLVLFWLASRV